MNSHCRWRRAIEMLIAGAMCEWYGVALAQDVTPPLISGCETRIVVTTGEEAVVHFEPWVTASDDTDPTPSVTFEPSSGSALSLGEHPVNVRAWDASGNTSTCSFVVFVAQEVSFADDFEAPFIASLWNVQQENGVLSLTTEAAHSGSQSVKMQRTGSGQLWLWLEHGFTQRMFGTVSVWVRDTAQAGYYATLNILNTAFSATGPWAGVGTMDWDSSRYWCHYYGENTQPTIVSRTPGWHRLSISAQPYEFTVRIDDVVVESLPSSAGFELVKFCQFGPYYSSDVYYFDDFEFVGYAVPDLSAPVIACSNIVVGTYSDGEYVTYTMPVQDDTDPSPSITYDPPSGSFFSVGDHVVTVTAWDAAGHTSVCQFVLSVQQNNLRAWGNPCGYNAQCQSIPPSHVGYVKAVEAGQQYSVVVRSDGGVLTLGAWSGFALSPPEGLSNVVAVSAGPGASHVLALRADGTVTGWGYNNFGEADIPPGLDDVVAIAAGGAFNLALRSDGSVVPLGAEEYGRRCYVPWGLAHVVAIAAGRAHALALTADGQVVAWGDNSSGQCDVPSDLSNVVAIAASKENDCSFAVTASGTLVAWGSGWMAQNIPEDLGPVRAVSPGAYHALAIRQDGTIRAWGANWNGQCDVPEDLDTNALAVSAGYEHSLAIAAPTMTADTTPPQILGCADRIVVAENPTGAMVVCAVRVTDDLDPAPQVAYDPPPGTWLPIGTTTVQVRAWDRWGNTSYCEFAVSVLPDTNAPTIHCRDQVITCSALEDGALARYDIEVADDGDHSPVVVFDPPQNSWLPLGTTWVTVIAWDASGHTNECQFMVMVTRRTIAAWGDNGSGQSDLPANLTNVVAIAAGNNFTVALRGDGSLWVTGACDYGQCWSPPENRYVAVAAGAYHALALANDGSVTVWGNNDSDQYNIPEAAFGGNVVSIGAGAYHCFAILRDGTVVAWGNDEYGQCAVPPGLRGVLAVDGGENHSIALTVDGRVVAWGDNQFGQCEVPEDLTNAIGVAAGDYHNVALRADGTVVAWGNNDEGQCSVPEGLNDVAAIAAAGAYSVAIRTDGTVIAWGANDQGQCDVPAGLDRVVAVAAGYAHVVVLTSPEVADNTPPLIYGCESAMVSADYTGAFALTPQLRVIDTQDPVWSVSYDPPVGTRLAPGTHHVRAYVQDSSHNTSQCDFDLTVGEVTLAIWGDNQQGLCNVPGWLTNVVHVAGSSYGAIALLSDGTAVFGGNLYEESGGGEWIRADEIGYYEFTDLIAVAAGERHVIGLRADGQVVVAGGCDFCECCRPDEVSQGIVAIAAGLHHNVALRQNGRVVTWGDNGSGQCEVPDEVEYAVAIGAGAYHSLAVLPDGRVAAWGNNDWGQCNAPSDVSNAVAVAGGYTHSLALLSDGTVRAWGANDYGQCDVPAELSNVVAIAAGPYHSVALTADGRVVAWGENEFGQCDLPETLATAGSVAAGWGGHTFVVLRPQSADTSAPVLEGCEPIRIKAGPMGDAPMVAQVRVRDDRAPAPVIQYDPPLGTPLFVGVYTVRVSAVDAAGNSNACEFPFTVYIPRVVGWGDDSEGQCDVPEEIATNVVAVAAGEGSWSAVLTRSGDVWVSKRLDGSGILGWELVAQDIVSISAGPQHLVALTSYGSVIVYPNDNVPWCQQPDLPRRAVAVAAGYYHNLALLDDGRVVAWGENSSGECDIPIQYGVPEGLLRDVIAIAAGDGFSAALKADGSIATWGDFFIGELVTNVVQIAAGRDHLLALMGDGTVRAWGRQNDYGQCDVPEGLSHVVAISTRADHNIALLDNGDIVVWGRDAEGQGDPGITITGLVAVAAGGAHNLVMFGLGVEDADAPQIFGCGAESYVEFYKSSGGYHALTPVVRVLDDNDPAPVVEYDPPLGSRLPAGIVPIRVRAYDRYGHTNECEVIARVLWGDIVAWGRNTELQCEVPPEARSGIRDAAAGSGHALAVFDSGQVIAWGDNQYGQCDVPSDLNDVVQVAAGGGHSLALRADGTVVAWGNNSYGQCDVPQGLSGVVAIDANWGHSLALLSNGTVVVWGDEGAGAVQPPSDLSNVVAISAGLSDNMALLADGTVRLWGWYATNILAVPPGLSDVMEISVGSVACAIRTNGELVIWGGNEFGLLDVPPDVTNAIRVASACYHVVVQRADGQLAAWGQNVDGQCNVPEDLPPIRKLSAKDEFNLVVLDPDRPDTDAPHIFGVHDRQLLADSMVGVPFSYDGVVVLDDRDDSPAVIYDPEPGTILPLGTSVVSVTASDAGGNSTSVQFRVVVWLRDTEAPAIVGCERRVVYAGSNDIALADYAGISAQDDQDIEPTIGFEPPNGTSLPLGTHTITVRAWDRQGNTNECQFELVVARRPDILGFELADQGASGSLSWVGQVGLFYEIYASTDSISDSMEWMKLEEVVTGTGDVTTLLIEGIPDEISQAYFCVVVAGEAPTPERLCGYFRYNLNPGPNLLGIPVASDRRFDGVLGEMLSQSLIGDDGAQGDHLAVLDGGSWRVLYMDSQRIWRELGTGYASTYELPPGAGLYVIRNSSEPARIALAGAVGNTGQSQCSIMPGWNLLSLSEGRDVSLAEVFAGVAQGGATEETADQLILQTEDGRWRRLMYVEGWGAPYDGKWFDLSTYQVVSTNEVLRPGQAYYYLRRGGAVELRF